MAPCLCWKFQIVGLVMVSKVRGSHLKLGPLDEMDHNHMRIASPEEIACCLFPRNGWHFGQAHGAPFTEPPLSAEFSWDASTNEAELVLTGDCASDELSDLQSSLLQHCARCVPEGLPFITLEEARECLQCWNEKTSTSPLGCHLGFYKAMVCLLRDPHKECDPVHLATCQETMLQAQVDLIDHCIKHGHTLNGWKNVLNVVIEKEPGNCKIHKLRVIHLFEADLSLFLSVKWKQAQQNADQHGALSPLQFGGRPGHAAAALPFIKELKNEICCCSRRPLINMDNDAASCHDRIVLNLASLVNGSHGVHRNVVAVHARTLQQAKFRLQTATGASDEFHQHCAAFPICGTGQGAPNAPQIWTFISSTMFKVHGQLAHGAHFESPDRDHSVRFSILGFVDDSDYYANHFDLATVPTAQDLIETMQSDAQIWHDSLWTSGGALELHKCSYHFIHCKFQPDGTPMTTPGVFGPRLTLTDFQDNSMEIKQLGVHAPHETLGHWKGPDGHGKKQLKQLIKKQGKLSAELIASPADASQASTFYHTICVPSVCVLPQSHCSSEVLEEAEKKSMCALFAKCGFHRGMRKDLLCGLRSLSGGGFLRWYWIQGEGQVLNFLQFWRTDQPVGTLSRIAAHWVQMNLGVGHSIFECPDRDTPHGDSLWFASLRAFLAHIKGSLQLDNDGVAPLQRCFDSHLMDLALEIFDDPCDLTRINHCRLFLDVVTMSDIATETGDCMDSNVLVGEKPASVNKGLLIFQADPGGEAWLMWDKFMDAIASDGVPHRPLGQWLDTGQKLRRDWQWHCSVDQDLVFESHCDGTHTQCDRFGAHCI